MECIDLQAMFGRRYRVTYEESYYAEHGPGAFRRDPWLMIIPCRGGRGHIFPWGGRKLAASADRRGVGAQLARLDCCEVVQDGDEGITCTFDVADFERVAAVMQPKIRPRLSEERRRQLRELGLALAAKRNGQFSSHSRVSMGAPDV